MRKKENSRGRLIRQILQNLLGDDPLAYCSDECAYKRACSCAKKLIDQGVELEHLIDELKDVKLSSFDYAIDRIYLKHQISVLTILVKDTTLWPKIVQMSRSPGVTDLSAKELQKCVVTAMLTPLRQVVGSCFATAPAIAIQRYHVEMFLEDVDALLSRGQIKRVISGQECVAPLNSIAFQNTPFSLALLRAWEYTLACFCDYTIDFYSYSLVACLGMNAAEEGGIGRLVFEYISGKLNEQNAIISESQRDAEDAYGQLKIEEKFFF